jgi:uncharacterized membrane protein (DUF2068 family)
MPDSTEIRITGVQPPVTATRRALRTIAVFEAIKGLAVLAAVAGALDLMHRDVRHLAMDLIGHFGLNPDARYPSMLLHYAELLPQADVRSLLSIALAYILVRLLEAYGLWNDKAWAEWLAALSGGIYIPFEIGHLAHRFSAVSLLVLAANVLVVGFMLYRLRSRPPGNGRHHGYGPV